MNFTEYAQIAQDGYFTPVEGQIQILKSRLQEHDFTPFEADGCVRNVGVILSGILPPPSSISEAIENAGLRVVGNDIASLFRSYSYTPEATGDPGEYYVDFYQNHYPCTTILHSSDRRIDALQDLIGERKAQGFMFIGEKFCEYEYFEIPYLEKLLKDKGVNVLSLEFSIDDDQNIGTFKTRIEAFSELMEE